MRTIRVIAGPTASGKSALALAEARAKGGVVINADASQMHAAIRIVSAQPTAAEQADVPHRLFGFLGPEESCSAARWACLARAEVEACWQQGALPILVGGTGLYLRTLIDGIAPVPDIAPEIRAEVRRLSPEAVRTALLREDPAMAARLHPNDPQRNARALEVMRATGRSLFQWQQAPREGGLGACARIDALVLEPPRALLHQRIGARIAAMWAEGALEEVRAVASLGLAPSTAILRAIGVPPLLAHLEGRLTAADALARWALDTRRYAKRQATWFRHQAPDWPRASHA
ncbi:MAG: tRNA (adenosine(37)-N6)-dimethylallyltransferase MiaA [Sphingomonadaceae bacterium]